MIEWKTIENNRDYEVSNMSIVREKSTGKYLKHYTLSTSGGSRTIVYLRTGTRKGFRLIDLANLVAEYFVDNKDGLDVVDFKDGDSSNCLASNLYYRNKITDRGYFHKVYESKTDEEYIKEAIADYRKKYPNDYFMEDKDLEIEYQMKMLDNRNKGFARTLHLFDHAKIIHNQNSSKIEEYIDDTYSNTTVDIINDEFILNEIDKIENNSRIVQKLIYHLNNTLTTRESFVLKYRYGLLPDIYYKDIPKIKGGTSLNNAPYTLEDTGRQLGVTKERIRQIEARAFRKLRHPSRLGGSYE